MQHVQIDRIVVTVQLTGFFENSTDVFFKRHQDISPLVVRPHVRELGDEYLLGSCEVDPRVELYF